MPHNGGETVVQRELEMLLYDALPPLVRRELQDAAINLGSLSARRLLARYDVKETADIIRQAARQETIRQATRLWNADHPQAKEWAGSYQLHPVKNRRLLRARLTRGTPTCLSSSPSQT